MPTDRLRSIVPMFGGGDRYVETLTAILEYIEANQPTTDELVGWHRGAFENVSSRDSILRRVSYLEQVGFLREIDDSWKLDEAGAEYTEEPDPETLLRIMCERNVGLRSLLYELTVGPMTIGEISEQQLDTHPELGWTPGETDMALQRANWLRSLGAVQKRGERYALTDEGRRFVEDAVEEWAGTAWTPSATNKGGSAEEYETTAPTRAVDPEFRVTVLSRYDQRCPVSGVDHPGLLDVAHVLSWSEYPDFRGDLSNVLPLSKTHHAAFDRELFTIDSEYRVVVNPSFETESDLLKRTILDREAERISILEGSVDPDHFRQHNSELVWV